MGRNIGGVISRGERLENPTAPENSKFVAATEPTNQLPLIKFDRYVAINTSVRMAQGVSKLDEFYRAPLN